MRDEGVGLATAVQDSGPAPWQTAALPDHHRQTMHIQLAQAQDMPRIRQLYEEAVAYQRENGFPFWKDIDFSVVEADIAHGHQYKVIVDRQIAGIFSLCPPSPMDEGLWQAWGAAPALYINRTIVGRQWRGHGLFPAMVRWCEQEMRRQGIALLRLDTWVESTSLIRYYADAGFALIGESSTPLSPSLAPQYRGVRLALMQKSSARR
jgi:GNAT superfamily N-acetyltransferase